MELWGIYKLTLIPWYLCRLNYKPIDQTLVFPLEEKISVNKFQRYLNYIPAMKLSLAFSPDIREHKSNSK